MLKLKEVTLLGKDVTDRPIPLSDKTIEERLAKVIGKMEQDHFDSLIVYADLEHGNNFEYLVGFLPRFEEAVLVLHKNREAYLVLGNENLNKAGKARINATPVHMPHLSLPNQPMKTDKSVSEILKETRIHECGKIGVVGWKNFTSMTENNRKLFDIPHFLMEAIETLCPLSDIQNASYIFIGDGGARTTNNANEFAHYEFGAMLAANCMQDALDILSVGKSEMEIADKLDKYGQRHSVVTIMATGERFEKANMYPSDKIIRLGDRLSITTGFKGGLQSVAGYAVEERVQLPENESDYVEKVAIPYYSAIKQWLETVEIGKTGAYLYEQIANVLDPGIFGWKLNPGHLCSDEEWLSSPIYENSKETIKSGMLFQLDIIPSVKGYGGVSCESGVMIADKELREQIRSEYPDLYQRIRIRQAFMRDVLGINISDDVVPSSNLAAVLRPYLLNKNLVMVNE